MSLRYVVWSENCILHSFITLVQFWSFMLFDKEYVAIMW